MNHQTPNHGGSGRARADDGVVYYKRDFWETENLKYTEPHFRMCKVARIIQRTVHGKRCDLLDVGCGPAALARLLPPNVHYYGIDIAIKAPAQNLMELDIVDQPIGFRDQKFDIVVAQGLFEYIGQFQSRKFAEIAGILRDSGKFVVTYQNFAHRKREIYWPYSNVQRPDEFRADLEKSFTIERSFPLSHNWNHSQPNRRFMKAAQARLTVNIPVVSRMLAVDYLYICSPLRPAQ
jgi:SAM-dependent methyltransferase